MAKIAQTAAMYQVIDDSKHFGSEWFESRSKKGSEQAAICGGELREYFRLPKKVTKLWIIAHDTPIPGSLHVSLQIRRLDWVFCYVVDKDIEFPISYVFGDRMDRYLIKLLRLTEDDVKDIYVTCEYQ